MHLIRRTAGVAEQRSRNGGSLITVFPAETFRPSGWTEQDVTTVAISSDNFRTADLPGEWGTSNDTVNFCPDHHLPVTRTLD